MALDGRESYGPSGFAGILNNPYTVVFAAFISLGGLLFGYDQGVVSVILTENQFLARFPRISESHPGSGFWKGLVTAMIELGALLGALNQGWIADMYSRKHSIVMATLLFSIGSIIQTASTQYATLIAGRLVGGIGVGMLSMVVPAKKSQNPVQVH